MINTKSKILVFSEEGNKAMHLDMGTQVVWNVSIIVYDFEIKWKNLKQIWQSINVQVGGWALCHFSLVFSCVFEIFHKNTKRKPIFEIYSNAYVCMYIYF